MCWEQSVQLIGGAEGTGDVVSDRKVCASAEKCCVAADSNVTQIEGGAILEMYARAGAKVAAVAVMDTPAQDTAALEEDGAFAFKMTKSTLSGRSLLNCFKAFALSHESETVTSNELVKSIMYSSSDGIRLNT
jgi:hypothetical protein